MNSTIRWCNSSTEAKLPRFSSRRTRMENHNSTWLSHEVCVLVCRQSVSGELGSEEKCAARPSLSCAPDYPSHPTPPRLSILWPLALPAPPTGGCLAGPPRRSTRPQGQWRWSSGDVSGEVFIGAGRPYGGGYDLARGHLEVGEQTPCAVALILVLLALNGACSHRKRRMQTLQRLDGTLLIGAQQMCSLFIQA
jgi:hypothetical protein